MPKPDSQYFVAPSRDCLTAFSVLEGKLGRMASTRQSTQVFQSEAKALTLLTQTTLPATKSQNPSPEQPAQSPDAQWHRLCFNLLCNQIILIRQFNRT